MQATARLLLALCVAATAACGGDAGTEDMQSEVQAAAQALLDQPGFRAVSIRRGEERAVTRVDWLDWRAGGDFKSVAATRPDEGVAAVAFTRVGDDLYSAQLGTDAAPWAPVDSAIERIPVNFDLAGIADGSNFPLDLDGDVEAAREADEAGVRWTATVPHQDDRIVHTWFIGPDGVLRAYGLDSESGGFIAGADSGFDFDFEPLADPPPIAPPEVGSDLDLAELGVPADLPLIG